MSALEQAEERMSENGVPIRIAVAEDEPDVRKTFVRLLECLGHKVVFSLSATAKS